MDELKKEIRFLTDRSDYSRDDTLEFKDSARKSGKIRDETGILACRSCGRSAQRVRGAALASVEAPSRSTVTGERPRVSVSRQILRQV